MTDIKLYRERSRVHIQMLGFCVNIDLQDATTMHERSAKVSWSAIGQTTPDEAQEFAEAVLAASVVAKRFELGMSADEAMKGYSFVDVYAERSKALEGQAE